MLAKQEAITFKKETKVAKLGTKKNDNKKSTNLLSEKRFRVDPDGVKVVEVVQRLKLDRHRRRQFVHRELVDLSDEVLGQHLDPRLRSVVVPSFRRSDVLRREGCQVDEADEKAGGLASFVNVKRLSKKGNQNIIEI